MGNSMASSYGERKDYLNSNRNANLYPRVDVSQATSITTAVSANGKSGVITTQSASVASQDALSTFTVNNSYVSSASIVLLDLQSYSGTLITNGIPNVIVSEKAEGSFNISVINSHSSNALSGILDIAFSIV